MAWTTLVAGIALVLASCGGTTVDGPKAAPKAHVHGMITAGPTCPVERVGHPCPPRAVIATVRATVGATIVASTRSASDGSYALDLPTGTYTISAEGASVFPRCDTRQLEVDAAAVVEADILCDTGIR